MKTEKNYLFKEIVTDMVFFCHVQVSKKFMATVDTEELELLLWMRDTLAHRTAAWDAQFDVSKVLEERVKAINSHVTEEGRRLVLSWLPLNAHESGFFRIERTGGRHQSVLLPVIDCRGSMDLTAKDK